MNLEQIGRDAGHDLLNVTTATVDIDARLAELPRLRRRRATTRALVAAALVAAVAIAAGSWLLGFGFGSAGRTPPASPAPAVESPAPPSEGSLGVSTEPPTAVAYCVAPSELPGEDTLHVDGHVVHTPCKWRFLHRVHVWNHAGHTVIDSEAESLVYLVDGGSLVRLGTGTAPRISDDGRYLLWFRQEASWCTTSGTAD